MHVDNTARPQLVRREDNPAYYRIIEEYRRRTGVPVADQHVVQRARGADRAVARTTPSAPFWTARSTISPSVHSSSRAR